MLIWGVYYELIAHSNFRYINENLSVHDHPKAWGLISLFKSTAYVIGPLAGGILLERFIKLPFIASLLVFMIAGVGYLWLFKSFRKVTGGINLVQGEPSMVRKRWLGEFITLIKLMKTVWPLWLFILALFLVDASFWSVGAVLTEELRNISPFGGLLLTLYMLPSLFVGVFIQKLAKPWGKKKIAFFCGCVGGLLLWCAGWTTGTAILLLLVFFSSVCGAIAVPEMMATFEDYVVRLKEYGGEMVSVERLAENAAYVIGPILAGGLSVGIGTRLTLGASGLFLMLVSIICVLVVPRKIRMPRTELGNLT